MAESGSTLRAQIKALLFDRERLNAELDRLREKMEDQSATLRHSR